MRLGSSIVFGSFVLTQIAFAACPPGGCFLGGAGPSATDCIIMWSGITAAATTCVDGSACDQDGTADGVCTFPLEGCLGDASCGVTAVTSVKVRPTAGVALQGAIQALAPGQCTAPGFTVPVKHSAGLGPIKPGVAKLKVTVVAGKKDLDKVTLTCQPAVPSFANDVQPILTQRCTQAGGCHDSTSMAQGLVLDSGAYGHLVGAPCTGSGCFPNVPLVTAGNLKRSYMARKLTGKNLKSFDDRMPQGCPGAPLSVGGCPGADEIYTLLSWIQAGAPNN